MVQRPSVVFLLPFFIYSWRSPVRLSVSEAESLQNTTAAEKLDSTLLHKGLFFMF